VKNTFEYIYSHMFAM